MLPSLGVGEQRNKMETLEAFRLAGKIRYAGFSNWSQSRAEEAHLTAQRLGVKGFVASQNMWSLAKVDLAQADPTWNYIDESFVRWHIERGIALGIFEVNPFLFFHWSVRKTLGPA
jgi:hypothetical protein